MTNADMPQSASEWTKYLLGQSLPSPFKVGRQTLKAMESETLSYAKIAQQLTNDPVLSYYLMNAAGRDVGDHTEYSKTLDHAISMVGVETVERTIKSLPFESPSSEDIQSVYYAKMLARSLFSAHLARAIAIKKGQFNSEDLYWSGLFVYVPQWYMWRFATPEMRLLSYAVNSNNKPKDQAQIEILNCTIDEIATELSKELALPPIAKQCFEPEEQIKPRDWIALSRCMKSSGQISNQIEDRELLMQVQQPTFIVQLVKLIADNAMLCWYSRGTQRALRILAAYLNITRDEAMTLCHEVAAEASRAHPIPGIFLPAARLFLPPVEFKKQAPASIAQASSDDAPSETLDAAEQTSSASPDANAGSGHQSEETTDLSGDISAYEEDDIAATETQAPWAPTAFFTDLVDKMYKTPDQFADLHELMNGATAALVYGLGMTRATVSLINKERTRLKTYYNTGCQGHDEMINYDTRLVQGTIFHRLALKSASVWVNSESGENVLSLVPSNFKQVVEVDDYMLKSIFIKDKPFAIIYGDSYQGAGLSEEQYKYFKYLCKGVTIALEYLVRNKGKKTAQE